MNGQVTLKHGKNERVFEFEHALALLRLQSANKRENWKLVDKKWKFENNELIKSKRVSEETEK